MTIVSEVILPSSAGPFLKSPKTKKCFIHPLDSKSSFSHDVAEGNPRRAAPRRCWVNADVFLEADESVGGNQQPGHLAVGALLCRPPKSGFKGSALLSQGTVSPSPVSHPSRLHGACVRERTREEQDRQADVDRCSSCLRSANLKRSYQPELTHFLGGEAGVTTR